MAEVPLRKLREDFIDAACWHGELEPAEAMLAAHPELRSADIHIAAILGDDAAVRRFIAQDPSSVTAKSGPWGADPLTCLGLSKYLRLDRSRTDALLRTATALLDAGAPAQAGFWNDGEFETALYGAAGVAHHEKMTRLLIERGADPNDLDTGYHAPEGYDLGALKVLVETGKLTPDTLCMMLVRKSDWHDEEGVRYLLEHGADPNCASKRDFVPIQHALLRDNSVEIIALLLDHAADPLREKNGLTSVAVAAREGRSDVLEVFRARGVDVTLQGVDELIAACAMGDTARARDIAKREPRLVAELKTMGGNLLAKFAGTDNPPGVRALLDMGVDVAAPSDGDGYHGQPKGVLAIHVAAWRLRPNVVKVLLARGSPVDVVAGPNRMTPLALAAGACVNSYWSERCSPDLLRMLLDAGASTDLTLPNGQPLKAMVDDLLGKGRA